MILFKIELGKEVKDSITGYAGTVTARCEYITGCMQYQVTPKCKKGDKYDEGTWLDEDRLVPPKTKKKTTERPKKRPDDPLGRGGPQSNPPPMK